MNPALSNSPSRTRSTILVVDDIADNANLLKVLLELEGYQVMTASDGPAALEAVQNHIPDLILLDVMMPEMSGPEVVQQLQQNPRLSQIPILLITGYDQDDLMLRQAGISGIIRKPFDFEQLLSQVSRLLVASGAKMQHNPSVQRRSQRG